MFSIQFNFRCVKLLVFDTDLTGSIVLRTML